jgi:uncharacterized protein (TIRG00374 family)
VTARVRKFLGKIGTHQVSAYLEAYKRLTDKNTMKIFKKILSIVSRVSTSVILLVLLFRFNKIDLRSLLGHIKSADKYLLFLAAIIFLFNYILCFYRWEMLLNSLKVHLPLRRIAISFSGGTFFNLFLPSTISGDLIRSMDLTGHTSRPKEIIATVFLDRLSGSTGMVLLSLIALLFGWRFVCDNKIAIISVLIITGISVFILTILFNNFFYLKINNLLHSPNAGKIRELIKNLHQEIYLFRQHKAVIVNNLIFSVLIQAISPLTSFIIALSLGAKINIIYFFIFLPIIGAISLLPISIGGLGIRENMTTLLFKKAGMSESVAVAMSILNFAFIVIYAAMGGLIYVLYGCKGRR